MNNDKFIKLMQQEKWELAQQLHIAHVNNDFLQQHLHREQERYRKLESKLTGAQLLIGKMSLNIFQSWDGPNFPERANPFYNPTPWAVDYEEHALHTDSDVED